MKQTIIKRKKQPFKWGKVFVNETFDNGLLFKIYKKIILLIIKNNKQSNWKWAEGKSGHLYMYNLFTLMYSRNECNIVYQLYSRKIN